VVGRQNGDIASTLHLGTVLWQPFFGFLLWGAHWCQLANASEPFMCGSDATLCQITLTTCYGRPVE